MKKFIDISAFAPPPSKQLKGAKLSEHTLKKMDWLANALVTCYLHGLISEKAFAKGVKKLDAEIRKEITKQAND